MSEFFKDEFCLALSSVHSVCQKYVTEDGLSLVDKKTAVECSFNLLVDMLVRLPISEREMTLGQVSRILVSSVRTEVAKRGL